LEVIQSGGVPDCKIPRYIDVVRRRANMPVRQWTEAVQHLASRPTDLARITVNPHIWLIGTPVHTSRFTIHHSPFTIHGF
jgi:hypothetical protein